MLRDGLIAWTERPRASASGKQLAVIALAIDDLDMIEDRFGRAMHDRIFVQAVPRLQALLKENHAIARIGDTFALGLDDIPVPEGETLGIIARRIQTAFEEPFTNGPARTYCSVSIGIAVGSRIGASPGRDMVTSAMRAAETAALSGPGTVRVYDHVPQGAAQGCADPAQKLRNALETNEIFAWFQPQIRISDGKVAGFEALARWDHPERGLLSPASFLPDIEDAGLSQRLAEVVLKQSLMALKAWDAAGFGVPSVSVNFSADELRNPRLPDYVRWELDRHDIAADRLAIEVLETVVSNSSEDVTSRTLAALARIGCRIDLDDFGTGFTSFANIRRFHVDRIKIDRSLVNRIDRDERQFTMLSALVAFGKRLGLETLAEGVETSEEAHVLASLGCGLMQGYAISEIRSLPLFGDFGGKGWEWTG